MIKHPSITEQLVESIRQKILDGVYPPNTALRQDALAEEHGVSRIPIREVLFQLDAEGLVTMIPRKGAVVTALSKAEIADIFELRLMLERRLFEASAPLLETGDLADIKQIGQLYAEAVTEKKMAELGELNIRLHMALYNRANMPKTKQIVASLLQASERYTRIQLNSDEALGESVTEHNQIIHAIESQQFQAAADLMQSHLQDVWQGLAQAISSRHIKNN